jgi:antitoxin (DNA-binding transcriptional repressor) of toxin-antitoxin stability system
MVTKLIGVKEFRQNMAKYSAKAKRHGWRYVVLNRNVPIFEVKPLSKKEAIMERLAADIAEARQQVRDGKVMPLEDALRSLGL